jgi:uncharacterized membrane protein YgaE (UPF0421/DUF939 family)
MNFRDIVRKLSLITAIQMALAVSLSYLLATKLAILLHFKNILTSGLWAGISSIVVMQVQIKEAHHASRNRILGSLIGGLCSGLIAMWLGYTIISIVATMFITTILLSLLKLKSVLRLANLTALIIIVTGMSDPSVPSWKNALARVLESTVGISISLIFVWIFHPILKKFDLFQSY